MFEDLEDIEKENKKNNFYLYMIGILLFLVLLGILFFILGITHVFG